MLIYIHLPEEASLPEEIPVPEEVTPGVWWLHGTRGSNVFAIEYAPGSLAIVDTGFLSSANAILADIARIPGGPALTHILLTHGHLDHCGAAAVLRGRTGAAVVAGRGDCVQHQGQTMVHAQLGRSHLVRRLLRGRFPDVVVDRPLEGDAEIAEGLRAFPVPGHTPGSYCYIWEPAGIAFIGDLAISHGGSLTRSMRRANADDAEYHRALAAFARVAPQAVCPGHGVPVHTGSAGQLDALSRLGRGRRGGGPSRRRRWGRLRTFAVQLLRRRRPRQG